MRARDFINSRLKGFLEYLRMTGVNPNNIRTDHLYLLALLEEYTRYQAMMQAWKAEQERQKAEEAAKWEDAIFVSVWDGGRELRSEARVNLESGAVEVVEYADTPEDLEVLEREYLLFRNESWELLKDEDGNYRIELPDIEDDAESDSEEPVPVEV